METKNSIFDLPTDVRQLPGISDPMSRMLYEQHPSTRDVTGANFPNGQIHHRFEVSGTKRWIPSKSYIRMRCKLTQQDGATTLTSAEQIAPNMGLCANLFQSSEFRIADKTVSRCSDYMAQIDALETRMDKSKSWLDSTGEVTNFWQANVRDRIAEVSSDGKQSKEEWEATKRLELGYVGDTKVAITVTTGVLTFSDGTLPNTDTNFVAGDEIELDLVAGTRRYTILEVPAGGSTLVINESKATVAVVAEFRRYRRKASRRVGDFELIWQPPMSIFKVDKALPSGKYELVLNPQTSSSYKVRAAETLVADKKAGAGNDYDFSVVDMYLYVATVESDRIDDLSYYINLDETRVQVDTGFNTSLTQKNFDVSPSTYALTCAFQDQNAGSDPFYSASKFKVRNSEELTLQRMFLTYAGQSKPSPDADPSFVVGTDRTVQRYSDSLLQSGQYFREGGSETIDEFHERGSYYHFAWPRDGRDRSSRCQVNAQLSTGVNARVLLFDHYKSICSVNVKDGRVVDVSLLEA